MNTAILDIPLRRIDGTEMMLREYKGDVLMIVNVASECGLTPQYEGLEAIYKRFRNQGFQVLGFPANNFAGQEPGSNQEIQSFCRTSFGVDFPMFEKISVAGQDTHPLYQALIRAQPKANGGNGEFRQHLIEFGVTPNQDPEILWNFEKFLVSRDGDVVSRFAPDLVPEDPAIQSAIEAELSAAS
ncbi:MAG: glutathione peroxidase [Acidobacteriaceae bacterium]